MAEPTSFGFHNFKMVYELVNLLGKKCGVVINKQDLSYEPLEKFCIENQVEILARIPYDREAAELSAKGKIVCEEKEEYRVLFRDILKKKMCIRDRQSSPLQQTSVKKTLSQPEKKQ